MNSYDALIAYLRGVDKYDCPQYAKDMWEAAEVIEELATELVKLQGELQEGKCDRCGKTFKPWIATLCRDCDEEVARQVLLEEMRIK